MSRSSTWRVAGAAAGLALALAVPGSSAIGSSGGGGGHHGHGSDRVDQIDLPVGWQPEGVTTDRKKVYSGSLADGRILRADPRTGRTHVLPRSGAAGPAVGLDHDRRRDVLWVAGGPLGEVRVHDASSGRLLRTYTFPAGPGRFINDVVVTREAVYATDSFTDEIGVIPLDRRRKLPPSGPTDVLTVGGDFAPVAGQFNLNGIVESDGWLIAVQSFTGQLWRIDPDTGDALALDLGGETVANGDGLELDHDLLYVVRNADNLIAAVELDDDLTSGEVVEEITSDGFDTPTTAALVGHSLYVANARFGATDPATTDYWLTRVDEAD